MPAVHIYAQLVIIIHGLHNHDQMGDMAMLYFTAYSSMLVAGTVVPSSSYAHISHFILLRFQILSMLNRLSNLCTYFVISFFGPFFYSQNLLLANVSQTKNHTDVIREGWTIYYIIFCKFNI